ncbi:speckle-type POZ protein B-like [Leptopilina heterotoma]|uniref:speckle-type POZ protein B-like n=1 Tax=Leptopilina heterotoma TaxID=63436 RepID=UPI001CA7D2B1|nr:speckle-type POZ protein B-like [Leptopilina heterotoma]
MSTNNNMKFIPTFVKTSGTKSYTSKFKFQHYELNWTIEDFELICRSVKKIESPKFTSESLTNCQWFLELEPTCLTEDNENKFLIRLKNTENNKARVNARISFFDNQSEIRFIHSFVTMSVVNSEILFWKMSGSELCKKFGKAVPKDVLLKCKLSVFDSLTTVEEEPPVKRRKFNDLMENMTSLLSNENFKDVRFKLEDKEFTAHKTILAIQSPVFAAMFNNKMSEELTSTVEIKDIKPEIFQQMLNFVYNVEVEDLDKVALELFYVAEKYELKDLKTNCIDNLQKNLSAKTVIKTLDMADLYSLSDLKSECLKLLSTKWDVISKRKEWKNLVKNRSYLTVEVENMRQKLNKKENVETESNKSLSLSFVFRD